MQDLPDDLVIEFVIPLNIQDIVSLAASDTSFRRLLLKPQVNRRIAILKGFPFNLTMQELDTYERMSLSSRLKAAVMVNDERIVEFILDQLKVEDIDQYAPSLMQSADKPAILRLFLEFIGHNEKLQNLLTIVLEHAARKGSLESVKLLVEYGINDYKAAISSAKSANQHHVVEYLESL